MNSVFILETIKMSSKRIVIVGGVAGGMSAATRARRMNESASIIVLEKGGFVSFANCGLPYYLAGRIKNESKLLVTTPDRLKERFNIDARVHQEVISIDRDKKTVLVMDLQKQEQYTLPYDKLIIATGASAFVPPIPHVQASNVSTLRSMEDTQAIYKLLAEQKPRKAVIVGGGFIGLEMCEALRDRELDVTLVEKNAYALPPVDAEFGILVENELKRHGVNVVSGTGLKALHGDDQRVTAVETEDGQILPADLVILSIGVRPNTQLASAAGLTIGKAGGIAVDEYQRTNDPDVYAVGDVTELVHGITGQLTRIPLAGPANRQGRLAGEHAATGKSESAGSAVGSAIVQIFDLSVGMTGLGEAAAKRAGIDVDWAFIMPADHASYYPGAKQLQLKVIYEKSTGRVVGAQAAGESGVDKRIDVIATTIHFKGTVDDLAELDLVYAPQFAHAKDPIHMVGMVAQNQREGNSDSAGQIPADNAVLLDVRTEAEFAAGSLEGAKNIPVEDLRSRLEELDKSQPTMVFCQVGQRGYLAERILKQNGFEHVTNLRGGYTLAKHLSPVGR